MKNSVSDTCIRLKETGTPFLKDLLIQVHFVAVSPTSLLLEDPDGEIIPGQACKEGIRHGDELQPACQCAREEQCGVSRREQWVRDLGGGGSG